MERNEKITTLIIVLDTMHRLGQIRDEDHAFFTSAIKDLRDKE